MSAEIAPGRGGGAAPGDVPASRLHDDRERAQAWVWRLEEDVHEVRVAADAATEPARRKGSTR